MNIIKTFIDKCVLTIPILILMMSCGKESNDIEVSINDFPRERELRGIEIKIPPILLNPLSICIVDSFLVISQDRQDSILSIFSLPDGKLLKCFGVEGRGPNELNLSFLNVTLGPVFKSSQKIFAIGNQMTNILYYNIPEVIEGKVEPYKTQKLPLETNGFQAIGYFSDSIIIGAPYQLDMNLFEYYDEKLELFQPYPNKYPYIPLEVKRGIFACYLSVKPDNSKFALSYSNIGKIEIVDIDNNNTTSILYKQFPSLEENTGLKIDSKNYFFNPEQLIFCWEIVATNDFIYAKIFNSKYNNISDGKGPNRKFIPQIHVFDWKGQPKEIIKLDRYFSTFYVDQTDKYLYIIDNHKADQIVRYEL